VHFARAIETARWPRGMDPVFNVPSVKDEEYDDKEADDPIL
jgi:hypothetical protein